MHNNNNTIAIQCNDFKCHFMQKLVQEFSTIVKYNNTNQNKKSHSKSGIEHYKLQFQTHKTRNMNVKYCKEWVIVLS